MEGDFSLTTPKSRLRPNATSTVDRTKKSPQTRTDIDPSFGKISLNNEDLSRIIENEKHLSVGSLDRLLEQRLLANSSLQRANKVGAIPSKYFKPNLIKSDLTSNSSLRSESTISESDLLKTPRKIPIDTSTPRSSVASDENDENQPPRLSFGDAMDHFSQMISNPDISIDNFAEEFKKVLKGDTETTGVDSAMFVPAEEAVSKLLADENSWRRKNDIPLNQGQSIHESAGDFPSISISEFFQQKSNDISDLKNALSPTKLKKPVPLIDASISFTEEPKYREPLSVTAIAKLLANTENSPKTVISYLCQGQKNKVKPHTDNKSDDSGSSASLPVSQNTSYTSNYSSNDAMKSLLENKENIDNHNLLSPEVMASKQNIKGEDNRTPSPSSSSSRSSSSLTSLPNGMLPIQSTNSELVWGCVKPDKCVTKDFLLRNKSSKTLRVQCNLTGHQFKIRKDNRHDSEPLSACKFVLRGHESKPFTVSFIPTRIGAAIEELLFSPLDHNLEQTKKQCVRLFGYGGSVSKEFHGITKDTSGKFWLSLGRFDNRTIIQQKFALKNTGTLPSFSYISFSPKQVFSFSDVKIIPNFFISLPGERKEVTVIYTPNVRDYKVLQQHINTVSVTDIGIVKVVFGAEVNRGRLRRLCRKCEEVNLPIDLLSKVIKEKIKGEVMPPDVSRFKESPASIKDILETFSHEEIGLTLEQDPDQTLVPQYPDESLLFQTLCQETTVVTSDTVLISSCKLEPINIILSPPTKNEDCLYLISETTKVLHYETTSIPKGLEICPSDGTLSPEETVVLKVNYPNHLKEKLFKILVYVENEVFEADVKVIILKNQSNFLK